MNNILQAKQLCKTYSEGPEPIEVLKNLDFTLKKGERVAIVGASGSGKSTLLHCLSGLDTINQGEVLLDNQSFTTLSANKQAHVRNQKMGFIYQFHHLLAEFSALENVMMPLFIAKIATKKAQQQATAILSLVGLENRLNHKPSELSGGERQRVAIARALVHRPACLFADEPTGNLDAKTAAEVYQQMLEINQQFETSFIIVTHDLTLAKKMDVILTLQNGVLT